MEAARWQQVDRLFQLAIELRRDERVSWLEEVCGDDDELRQEVETLLRVDREGVPLLDQGFDPAIEEGSRVGRYRIGRKLGEGGMSVVHLARRADRRFERDMAIKFLKQPLLSRHALERFRLESQILGRLEHPNVARLYDAGATDRGIPYIVMEHVEGQRIDHYCARPGISLPGRLELFQQVCAAVAYSHRRLVVHRDLKPSNVLVTEDGVPKLLDFGIAKLLLTEPGTGRSSLTGTAFQPMTPQFASPEQLRSEPITTATDVYSLGMMLFLLLTGRLPYDVDELSAVELDRLRAGRLELPRASEVTPAARKTLRGDLDNIVRKSLAAELADRYSSVEQLSEDLERFGTGLPVRARAPTWGYRGRKFFARHRMAIVSGALALTLILGFAATMASLAKALMVERDRSRAEAMTAQEVTAFLVDLFQTSRPGTPRDRELTVREVLERANEHLDRDLDRQPEVRAELLDALGSVYVSQSRFAEAVPLLESSIALKRRLSDGDPDRLATSLMRLSSAEHERSNFERAEVLAREALAIQRRDRAESATVAEILSHLGTVLLSRGEVDPGETLIRQALEMRIRLYGEAHPSVGESYYDLSRVAYERRNPVAMERWCRRAREILAAARGEKDPLVLAINMDLAIALQDQGKLPDAVSTYRELLKLQQQIYGERHQEVAVTLNALGTTYFDLRDFEQAEIYLRASLTMLRELSGGDTVGTARMLTNLGKCVEKQGRMEDAAEIYREGLAILRERVDPAAPALGLPMIYLSYAWTRTGQAARAEPLVREAISLLEAGLGADHPRAALARGVLGACLTELGRYPEAEEQLLESLETLRRRLGSDHRHLTHARKRLETLYLEWGKPELAEKYRDAVESAALSRP